MRVLTRKLREVIRIGPDITIQVLRIQGDQIRLGITAPTSIRISREEPEQKQTKKEVCDVRQG